MKKVKNDSTFDFSKLDNYECDGQLYFDSVDCKIKDGESCIKVSNTTKNKKSVIDVTDCLR